MYTGKILPNVALFPAGLKFSILLKTLPQEMVCFLSAEEKLFKEFSHKKVMKKRCREAGTRAEKPLSILSEKKV
jgi:hypothetical protein